MRHRPAPKPIAEGGIALRRLRNDQQVLTWIKRLAADPEAKPTDLSEAQLAYVYEQVLARREEEFAPSAFEGALRKTTPIVAAPDITDWVSDLDAILGQPEMVDFWAHWSGRRPKRGPTPPYAQAKAFLALMAMTTRGAYGTTAYDDLGNRADVQQLFDEHERLVESIHGLPATSFAAQVPYSTVMRVKDKLTPPVLRLAMDTNILMVKELAKLLPGRGIGKRLMIDGISIPAWVPQKSAWSDDPKTKAEMEARLRARCPRAGFRVYTYKRDGKRTPKKHETIGETLIQGTTKKWRGYYWL